MISSVTKLQKKFSFFYELFLIMILKDKLPITKPYFAPNLCNIRYHLTHKTHATYAKIAQVFASRASMQAQEIQ